MFSFLCCYLAVVGKIALMVIEVSTLLDVFELAHLGLFLSLVFKFFACVFMLSAVLVFVLIVVTVLIFLRTNYRS